ncbi:MAG: branched-chain amino acid aminotransferase [Crocinitomicaceae bacterium]|nr:branched-chain amino acid aminotransferase [Crocinitomicaceae bacterium]
MQEVFRKYRSIAAEQDFSQLDQLEINVPEKFNWVRDVFEGINVKDHPKAKALIWTDGKVTDTFSFEQLSKEANAMLNFLRKHGVERNDIISFQMPLLPANWLTMIAGIKGGFRLIPIATILGVQDLVYRFGKLMPKVVLADADNAEKIDDAEELSGKDVPLKILVNGSRNGWHSLDEIYEESDKAEAADTSPNDPLFLFFTSGTTGMPKVVTHTHLSYPIGHLTTASWVGLKEGDIHYNISQPGWAKFAWSSFFAPWNVGAAIFAHHSTERFNAKETLNLMVKHNISTFCAPPTVLRLLIQEDLKSFDLNLRQCVAAGEPLNPEVIEAWKRGTGTLIRDGYGQTESTCIVANIPGADVKYGSMGKPTFLYDVVIADDEGNELPVDEEGNITVKTDTDTPNGIFDAYFGEPEKKKKVFKHGLYYTGDKAYKDADGYIWFVGRDDDVIKSSDYRVGPFEVESVLLEHESVQESAVVGTPHPVKGYEIKAFVILGARYTPSQELADELFAFSRKNMAPFKMPRVIEFVEELPKTISGKIRRIELRAAEAQAKAEQKSIENEFFYKK